MASGVVDTCPQLHVHGVLAVASYPAQKFGNIDLVRDAVSKVASINRAQIFCIPFRRQAAFFQRPRTCSLYRLSGKGGVVSQVDMDSHRNLQYPHRRRTGNSGAANGRIHPCSYRTQTANNHCPQSENTAVHHPWIYQTGNHHTAETPIFPGIENRSETQK